MNSKSFELLLNVVDVCMFTDHGLGYDLSWADAGSGHSFVSLSICRLLTLLLYVDFASEIALLSLCFIVG